MVGLSLEVGGDCGSTSAHGDRSGQRRGHGHHQPGAGRARAVGSGVPGPRLPQRLCPQPAGERAGRDVPHPAPGQPGPVAGAVQPDRGAVPRRGRPLRQDPRHPGGALRQGPAQGRGHARLPGRRQGCRAAGGGRGRGGAGVPTGVHRLPAQARRSRGAAVHLRQGRPAGELLLLLPVGSGVRPALIEVCAYFPYPMKVWVNGHEWAKQQATKLGIGFTELANGFAWTDDPQRLQQVCDRLGPAAIGVFFERWLARLPLPLGPPDRAAGYWWELSMRQVEVSRTLVLDTPRRARAFFEALVADNLGIGRPDEVSLIFDRRIRSDTDSGFATRVITRGVDVTVNVFYKHSRIKQYLKEGRALRVETVCNSPGDLGCQRRLVHLDQLQARARAANRRLLDTERAGPGCVLASPAFARVAQPSTDGEAGSATGALRFGDPRVMALAGALCLLLPRTVGFTHRSLRAQVTALLGQAYTASQMTYDLTRLRRKGLIRRLPRTNTYALTSDGTRFACSTPRSTTGCWSPCWPPTPRPHRHHCARRCTPSTCRSATTSNERGCMPPEPWRN